MEKLAGRRNIGENDDHLHLKDFKEVARNISETVKVLAFSSLLFLSAHSGARAGDPIIIEGASPKQGQTAMDDSQTFERFLKKYSVASTSSDSQLAGTVKRVFKNPEVLHRSYVFRYPFDFGMKYSFSGKVDPTARFGFENSWSSSFNDWEFGRGFFLTNMRLDGSGRSSGFVVDAYPGLGKMPLQAYYTVPTLFGMNLAIGRFFVNHDFVKNSGTFAYIGALKPFFNFTPQTANGARLGFGNDNTKFTIGIVNENPTVLSLPNATEWEFDRIFSKRLSFNMSGAFCSMPYGPSVREESSAFRTTLIYRVGASFTVGFGYRNDDLKRTAGHKSVQNSFALSFGFTPRK